MIKKGLSILIILGFGIQSFSQTDIKAIAREIASNNLSIKALAIENQMKSLDDKKEVIPDDPEIAGAYLWGSPSFIGNRTDLNANQRFKFPTYYGKMKKSNKLAEDIYARELDLALNQVIFESIDILIDLTSSSKLKLLLTDRLGRLRQIYDMANQKFIAGETNRIELEKAGLLVDIYEQDLLLLSSEEKILFSRLVNINSNHDLSVPELEYSDFLFLFDSENPGDALADNPVSDIANLNKQLADADLEVAKSGRLPDLLVGYTSEAVNGEKLGGIEMGLSIPLWGKTNQIKRARLNRELYDQRSMMTSQVLQNEWDNFNETARQSMETKMSLEASLNSLKSQELLEKSWQLGEISLLDYLKELPFYYGVEDRVIQAEGQYYKAMLERNRYKLAQFLGL